ncbi:MAG: hypothetical protein AABW82_03985 [Nanoarchaeota archaeon]
MEKNIFRDGNIIYDLKPKGPLHWKNATIGGIKPIGLRYWKKDDIVDSTQISNELFGEEKSLQTTLFSDIARLVSFAVINIKNKDLQPVIESLNNYSITGNTLTVWTPKGFYVIDKPGKEIISLLGRDYPSNPYFETNTKEVIDMEKNLNRQIVSQDKNGILHSEDRDIRFVPNLSRKYFGRSKISIAQNPGIIALVGNEENASLLEEAVKKFKLGYNFRGPLPSDKIDIRIPSLMSIVKFDYWLDINGSLCNENKFCSFGLKN